MQSHGGTKECGEGVRLRAIACYDKAGRLVEPSHCSSSGKGIEKTKCTTYVNDDLTLGAAMHSTAFGACHMNVTVCLLD